MIKISCLNSDQYDELCQLFLDKNIKHDPSPPKSFEFKPLEILVDLDEFIEVLSSAPKLILS